jgi:cytoskeletal protein CcmA (bactofilin family)
MIRMGRGNKEPESDYQEQPQQTAYNNYAAESSPMNATRAISESDSMARDIKEGRLSGFVGHGTTLTGETEFHAMLRVDGHLIGTVASETGTLIIGTNGQVDANIAVAAALVNGSVNGDIIASEKLQLGRTARVLGNIQSPKLIIEEGAILEGSCNMLKAREVMEEAAAAPALEYDPQPAQLSLAENEADYIEIEDDDESAEAATV